MDNAATNLVPEGRLRLSRSPVAELAAGALRARHAAGLEEEGAPPTEYVIVAVPAGAGERVADVVRQAVDELELEAPTA